MKNKLTCIITLGFSLALGNAFAQNAPDAAPAKPSDAAAKPAAEPAPAIDSAGKLTPDEEAKAREALILKQAEAAPADAAPALAQADTAAPKADAKPAEAKPAEVAPLARPDEPLPLIMFEEAPLNDAIKTLARQAGINFQFDPKVANPPPGPDGKAVQPPVSIRFENITAQQALEAVLANHDLQLVHDNKTKTSRITRKDPAAPEPLITRVIQLKYTDPTNLVTVVKPTISTRSTVTYDGRTSQLIVIATEKDQEAVEKLVNTLDTPTRQVLIEAHIYETSKSPSSIKGIDWTGTFGGQQVTFGNGNTIGTVTQTKGTTTGGASGAADGATAVPFVATPVTSGTGKTAGNTFLETLTTTVGGGGLALSTAKGFNPSTAFLNADGVSAVISFLNTDADTEVVSTPRAVTLDNQKATLSVVRAFPVFNITPGSANSPAGAQITYTNLGTTLEVTPRISANDTIALNVRPEVSNIDSKDTQTINGLVNVANVYAIRRIDANVVVPSGHTLVMGGLVSDSNTKGYTKVPILGDAPGIGALFRHESKTRKKQNLLLFIKPSVVQDTDFHSAPSSFLQTKYQERPGVDEGWWNSGKPHDWKKKSGDAPDGQ